MCGQWAPVADSIDTQSAQYAASAYAKREHFGKIFSRWKGEKKEKHILHFQFYFYFA